MLNISFSLAPGFNKIATNMPANYGDYMIQENLLQHIPSYSSPLYIYVSLNYTYTYILSNPTVTNTVSCTNFSRMSNF